MAEVLFGTKITDAMLVSTSALAEDPNPAWVSGTTYAIGNYVHRSTTHRVYKRTTAGAGTTPPENDPDNWKDWAPTNVWAMFDQEVATATVIASPFTVKLRPGMFNALYLIGLEGGWDIHLTYRASPGGAIVPLPGAGEDGTLTQSLEDSEPGDWWEYFFLPLRPASDFLLHNIEPYVDGELEITITGTGNISVGMLLVGDLKPAGWSEWGPRSRSVDYSYVDIKSDGNNTIMRGAGARGITFSCELETAEANAVERVLDDVRGVPCAVIVSHLPEHRGLRGFGLLRAEVSYDNPKAPKLSGNLEGLI